MYLVHQKIIYFFCKREYPKSQFVRKINKQITSKSEEQKELRTSFPLNPITQKTTIFTQEISNLGPNQRKHQIPITVFNEFLILIFFEVHKDGVIASFRTMHFEVEHHRVVMCCIVLT